MTITLDGDHLMAQLTGQGRNQIFPESETMFFLKVVDAQLEFAQRRELFGAASKRTGSQGKPKIGEFFFR